MLHLYIRKISREKMGEGRRRVVGHYIFVECIAAEGLPQLAASYLASPCNTT